MRENPPYRCGAKKPPKTGRTAPCITLVVLMILIWNHHWNYFFFLTIAASNNLSITICCENVVNVRFLKLIITLFARIDCWEHRIQVYISWAKKSNWVKRSNFYFWGSKNKNMIYIYIYIYRVCVCVCWLAQGSFLNHLD